MCLYVIEARKIKIKKAIKNTALIKPKESNNLDLNIVYMRNKKLSLSNPEVMYCQLSVTTSDKTSFSFPK